MKLELVKSIKVNGDVFYHVKVNGMTENVFMLYNEAFIYYNLMKEREQNKKESSTEVLLSEEI
jgi:hypothetical protein